MAEEKKKLGKKSESKKDRFGSRIGTNNAKVNACLSNKPKTMAELTKEAKIEGTVYTHLGNLIEKGIVEKSEKGFKLIKNPK
jgi:predicted transcriptional regulator